MVTKSRGGNNISIYLASPYSHPDPDVMEARFDAVCRAAGELMRNGEIVYSPIAHNHPIAVRIKLPRTWDFWGRIDKEFLLKSEKMIVLMIDGWKKSPGVTAEIAIAKEHGIPVEYIEWGK